jgi:AraC-like DNA-binding protein
VLLADGPTRLTFDGARVPAAHPLAPAAAVFEPVLDHQLQRLARSASWSQRVRAVIEHQLMDLEPTLGGVARHLHVSERSLQRHLGEEGTSFRQLLDDVRKALAQSWLHGQGSLASCRSITELAIVLGFSTNAALTRAFYRWFDMPPSRAKIHFATPPRRHP